MPMRMGAGMGMGTQQGMSSPYYQGGSPALTIVSALTVFTTETGAASAAQTFTVAGTQLSNDVVITVPASSDFAISLAAASGYTTTLTLTPASAGTLAATTIYIRLAGVTEKSTWDNVTVTSTGATSSNIAVIGHTLTLASYTWVATDGNNDTGNGSFATPYATLAKAESLTLTGDKATIYVKAGTYGEALASMGYGFAKAYKWIAYGAVTLQASSVKSRVVYMSGNTATELNGFIIDGKAENTNNLEIAASTETKTIKNCSFIRGTTAVTTKGSLYMSGAAAASLTNCTFTTTGTERAAVLQASATSTVTLSGCTFTGAWTNGCFQQSAIGSDYTNTLTATGCTFNIASNLINAAANTLSPSVITVNASTITLTGNIANLATYGSTSNNISTINLTSNTIEFGNYITTGTGGAIYLAGATNAFTANITGNTVNMLSPATTKSFVGISTKADVDISNNSVDVHLLGTEAGQINNGTGSTYGVIMVGNLVADNAKTWIRYNTIKCNAMVGYLIQVGHETTVAGHDNHMKDVQIIGNLIYGRRYYEPTDHTTMIHDIFIGFTEGAKVKYNKIIGGSYGIVLKHESATAATATIAYNLSVGPGQAIMVKGHANALIHNNTAACDAQQDFPLIYLQKNIAAAIAGVVVENNILYSTNGNSLVLLVTSSDVTAAIDYNIYSTTTAGIASDGVSRTWSAWQGLGYEEHGLNVVPDISLTTGIPTGETPNVCNVGLTLDAAYDDGLDYDTGFGYGTTPTTKQQTGDWDIGAFVI